MLQTQVFCVGDRWDGARMSRVTWEMSTFVKMFWGLFLIPFNLSWAKKLLKLFLMDKGVF